jgi:hypothetical protein
MFQNYTQRAHAAAKNRHPGRFAWHHDHAPPAGATVIRGRKWPFFFAERGKDFALKGLSQAIYWNICKHAI